MADEADITQDRLEREALYGRPQRPTGPAPTGYCHYCGEATPHRWCDAECRDAWEREHGRR